MQGNEVADLCIFIFCVVILVAYNLIYFTEAFRKKKFRFRGICCFQIFFPAVAQILFH